LTVWHYVRYIVAALLTFLWLPFFWIGEGMAALIDWLYDA
jgi:hypothetical protein